MKPLSATPSAEPRAERSRLGDILVDYGILTPDGVRAALARQQATGARFGEAVVALGLAKTNDLLWALSEQFGVRSTVLGAAMVD
ncbi:MAG: chain length determinant protein tyrosine kinase EpsG, partial [Candidatus Methylomirabilis sp.]|nr:chain length determinant protein tyrosine kinase EpsG [Deltaproteobacteria bacterium]